MFEGNPDLSAELDGLSASLYYDIGGSHLQISELTDAKWQIINITQEQQRP